MYHSLWEDEMDLFENIGYTQISMSEAETCYFVVSLFVISREETVIP